MCPRTTELLKAIPNVKAAMFASLPPGPAWSASRPVCRVAEVPPRSDYAQQRPVLHRGRRERYFWRDGESMMFDETYIHHAENTTQMPRVILFCTSSAR